MSLTDSINALAAQVGQYGVIPDGGIINGKPFGILDWARAGQERVEAAVEALRKARATDECRRVQESSGKWAISPIGECAANDFDIEQFPTHWTCASALLDGFSVDEITAAEEALA